MVIMVKRTNDVKKICEACGEEFKIGSKWGGSTKYCQKEECKRERGRRNTERYRKKLKDEKEFGKEHILDQKTLENMEGFKKIEEAFFKPVEKSEEKYHEMMQGIEGAKEFLSSRKGLFRWGKRRSEKSIDRKEKKFKEKYEPITYDEVAKIGLSLNELVEFTGLSRTTLTKSLHWMVFYGYLEKGYSRKKHKPRGRKLGRKSEERPMGERLENLMKELLKKPLPRGRIKYRPSEEHYYTGYKVKHKGIVESYPAPQISCPGTNLPYAFPYINYTNTLTLYGFDHNTFFTDKTLSESINETIVDIDQLVEKLNNLKHEKMREIWNNIMKLECKNITTDIGEYICYQFFDRINPVDIDWNNKESEEKYMKLVKENIFSPATLTRSYTDNRYDHYSKLPKFYYFNYLKMPKSIEKGWDMYPLNMMLNNKRKVSNFPKLVKKVIEKKLGNMSHKEKRSVISIVLKALKEIYDIYHRGITLFCYRKGDWARHYIPKEYMLTLKHRKG